MQKFENVQNFLVAHFADMDYASAVQSVRHDIQVSLISRQVWELLVNNVRDRVFDPGGALALVRGGAMRALSQNTDDAAYRWLDRFVEDVNKRGMYSE